MWKAIHFIASNEMDGFCVELCLMGLTPWAFDKVM